MEMPMTVQGMETMDLFLMLHQQSIDLEDRMQLLNSMDLRIVVALKSIVQRLYSILGRLNIQ